MTQRTIVVGDLHGCHDEALDLLDKLAVTSSDRVIFAGDLVDRGPKPRECVELAMRHEAILGNHEEKHLQQRRRDASKLSPDHLRTREALDDAHYAWLAKLPLWLRLPEANAVVVHAGVLPGRPIEDQLPHTLLHAQCISPMRCPAEGRERAAEASALVERRLIGPTLAEAASAASRQPDTRQGTKSFWPSKAPPEFTFWTNHWRGPERVIFGHSVLDRPLVTEHAVGIDTGCVHGLALTAVVLPDWALVSVPAREAWWGPKGGERVARFEVQAGVRCFS